MNPRKSLRCCGGMEMELDRISNLPEHVVVEILSYLTIKDAIKTSLLSTKWRHCWKMVPSLVFDNESFPPVIGDRGNVMMDKLARDIDRVILLHSGRVCKFVLIYTQSFPADDIDKWICHLAKSSLKEFIFRIFNLEEYKIPSSLFSCKYLTCLDISICSLAPPSTFKGFKYLKSLALRDVDMTQDSLEYLISSSPELENLVLSHPKDLSHLTIDAPNLQYFDYEGQFVDICLKNTSRLAVISMHTYGGYVTQNEYRGDSRSLIKFMAKIPHIKSLCIGAYSFQHLAEGDTSRELPLPFYSLRCLVVGIAFTSFQETSALVFLLRSVPNLQELQLESLRDDDIRETSRKIIWEADNSNCPLTRLRHISIRYFYGLEAEMDFIKCMLLIAPVLESIVIELGRIADDKNESTILKQLCCFKRASPLAEIKFC